MGIDATQQEYGREVRAAEAAKDDGAAANVEAKGSGLEEATKLLAELDAELEGKAAVESAAASKAN